MKNRKIILKLLYLKMHFQIKLGVIIFSICIKIIQKL